MKVVRRCRLCYKINGGVGTGEAPRPVPPRELPLPGSGQSLGTGTVGRAAVVSGPCGTVGPGVRVTPHTCCVPVEAVTRGYMCGDVMRPHALPCRGGCGSGGRRTPRRTPCVPGRAPQLEALSSFPGSALTRKGLGGWEGQEQVPVCLEWMPGTVTAGTFHQGPRLLGRGPREAWGPVSGPPLCVGTGSPLSTEACWWLSLLSSSGRTGGSPCL